MLSKLATAKNWPPVFSTVASLLIAAARKVGGRNVRPQFQLRCGSILSCGIALLRG